MSNQSLDLLNYFFYPKSVAIVGISRRKPSLGQLILDNLEITEYQGDIFLLNPKSEEIRGYKCYNKLEDLPSVPDLVLILIPPRFVKGIVESCIRLGIKAVTIISAGFSEASKEGALLEEEIGTVLRGNAIRIIGPNSMGTYSYRAHASFSPIPIDKGNIGFLSQSGSIVVALLEHLRVHGLGFSKFISLGNQLDVNLNHGIDYLKNDNDTQVITSYVESIPEVEPFRTLVTGISSSKPVLMVKSGRSEAGARAASSHTGALAGENRLVDALLASVGVIRASNIKELAILSIGGVHAYELR